jgi:hypothetical protein
MPINPRFTVLLRLYAQFDRMTLILAGIALAAVLVGWALPRSGSGRFTRVLTQIYYGFLIVSFVLILAGTLFLILGGAS